MVAARITTLALAAGPFSALFSSWLLSSLELNDANVHEPQVKALLGTASHFSEVFVLN